MPKLILKIQNRISLIVGIVVENDDDTERFFVTPPFDEDAVVVLAIVAVG